MANYRFKYRSEAHSDRKFLDDLHGVLNKHEFGGKLFQDICLTLSEAFTNALKHGNRFDPKRDITVFLRINKQGLAADIIDEGSGGLQQVAAKSEPGPLSESGRGVDLMQHYASDVRFEETPTGGLKVTLLFEIDNEVANR